MVPIPKHRNAQGSCAWDVDAGMELWWFSHRRRWCLAIDASSGPVTTSVSIDLGTAAPAALLLLAHQRKTP